MRHSGYRFAAVDLDEVLKTGVDSRFTSNCTVEDFRNYLTGKVDDGDFRVPAADGLSEVHFRGRDLLGRFTCMPTSLQEHLLQAIRGMMRAANEEVLHVENGPWGKNRVLRIKGQSGVCDKGPYGGPMFWDFIPENAWTR